MNHMSLRRLFLPWATILFLLSISGEVFPADSSPTIGTLQKVNGTATVLRQDQILPAQAGMEIQAHDTLRTGSDGSVGMVFKDDTLLSLGPDSSLVVDDFVFAPRQGKFSIVLRMMKGTAVYLSGLIAKLSPDSVRFLTPSASIGIRGTKFAVKVEGR